MQEQALSMRERHVSSLTWLDQTQCITGEGWEMTAEGEEEQAVDSLGRRGKELNPILTVARSLWRVKTDGSVLVKGHLGPFRR